MKIPISLKEQHGLRRLHEYLRVSVPFERSQLFDCGALRLISGLDRLRAQFTPIAFWSDGSIQWVLVDFIVSTDPSSVSQVYLVEEAGLAPDVGADIRCQCTPEGTLVDTGKARYRLPSFGESLIESVSVLGEEIAEARAVEARLTDKDGDVFSARISSSRVLAAGPVRSTIEMRGDFRAGSSRLPIDFCAEMTFFCDSASCILEIQIGNWQAARHEGNLWDLGDAGSFLIDDLSVLIRPIMDKWRLASSTSISSELQRYEVPSFTIYQDSSGGDRWNSPNHVDAHGETTVSFRGFRVSKNEPEEIVQRGDRATPRLILESDKRCIGISVSKFWQNFPKALRWNGSCLEIGLFPRESHGEVELQGGERKRHQCVLGFDDDVERFILQNQAPVVCTVDPAWVARSGAVTEFSLPTDITAKSDRFVSSIIDGRNSFFEKRELVDEYGWRHFGDVYADHEAVGWSDSSPLMSHYNNQYDALYAMCVHFLRSEDYRWRELMDDLARHVIDVDIYHTELDRHAYNGGNFWHTDHYMHAHTATHRTYSIKNAADSNYGGGPGNEHNYTSGLRLYFLLTGDLRAKDAVLELANWVIAMDDGHRSLLSFIDSRPTGRASCTVAPDFHKPGRGAGNSINALLDAFDLSREQHYLQKAEELIARCVHPQDDIEALGLDWPEHRWSYLVFLQILGKYLTLKIELGEAGYEFFYARDSLRHYAAWILKNEKPYKDILERLEIPSETWSAQDIRKCHVMHIVADCSDPTTARAYRKKAQFFYDRCIDDLLSYPSAFLTRPQVLIAAYGHIHGYYMMVRRSSSPASNGHCAEHAFDFGPVQKFAAQHPFVALFNRKNGGVLRLELWDVLRNRLRRAKT